MRVRILGLLAVGCLLMPSWAMAQSWTTCTGEQGDGNKVQAGEAACVVFTPSSYTDPSTIQVTARSSLVSYNSDLNSAEKGASRVYVWWCDDLPSDDADRPKTCGKLPSDPNIDGVLDDPYLDGDDASESGIQRKWIFSIPPGWIFIEMADGYIPVSGEQAQLKIKGY